MMQYYKKEKQMCKACFNGLSGKRTDAFFEIVQIVYKKNENMAN